MNTKRLNLSLIGILALALILRLVSLADHSLWYDEAFAVLFAEKGLDAMLYGTLTPVAGGAADIHPLLYYTTLNLWMRVFGESPFAVRLLSVLLGLISIGLIYGIGRDLFSRETGLGAALITALAPFHIHYSQETRMYTLLAVLLLGATWCFIRASGIVQQGIPDNSPEKEQSIGIRWRWWLAFGVLAGLAMHTQQLAAFYLMAIGLVPLIMRQRHAIIGMVLGTGIALLVYIPWLVNIPSQLEKINSYYWIAPPGFAKFFVTLYLFLTNYAEIPMPFALIGLAGSLVLVLFLLAQIAFDMRAHTRRNVAPIQTGRSEKRNLLLVLWLFAAPIILMWLVSQIQPVFLERGLITSAIMLYLLLGWLFTRSRLPRLMRMLLGMVGVILVLIGLASQYSLSTFPYAPYNVMIGHVREQWQEGDVVIHINKLSALPSVYYGRELLQRYITDYAGSAEDTLAVPTQEALQLLADPCVPVAASGARRVWFVTLERAEQQYEQFGRTELADAFNWLDAHFTADETSHFNDLNLYLYSNGTGNETTDCS
jgi:mannosyltransferase